MILKMAEKYNINLKNSYMIGDDIKDVKAGFLAGCQSIYLGENSINNCYNAKNLLEAVNFIFKRESLKM